jgi:hypothetical protein
MDCCFVASEASTNASPSVTDIDLEDFFNKRIEPLLADLRKLPANELPLHPLPEINFALYKRFNFFVVCYFSTLLYLSFTPLLDEQSIQCAARKSNLASGGRMPKYYHRYTTLTRGSSWQILNAKTSDFNASIEEAGGMCDTLVTPRSARSFVF